ncbi:serine O-acetyltransferase [Halosquirtibacter laminarini]|uniref:Serine O-acetyltransferase n=1 Tax=Halosquirtibacter laminarini TaxID=3374600 RepID=A0AC61NIC8_9BACT|nr:serine O-acetyltransferase [Prolixibacteraceae bacterium]
MFFNKWIQHYYLDQGDQSCYKGKKIISHYRLGNSLYHHQNKNIFRKLLFRIYAIYYHRFIYQTLCCDIPFATHIGKRFTIHHGHGIVIHQDCIIGEDVTIHHLVTIGNKMGKDGKLSAPPTIGNYVEIGAGAIILGDIHIGTNARIGAGAVVTKEVPKGATVVGNPAHIITEHLL